VYSCKKVADTNNGNVRLLVNGVVYFAIGRKARKERLG